MNQYITGAVIKELREKNHYTQAELAGKLSVSANMLRSHFYVCPVCGNVIHSIGEAVIHCHGILLTPCQEEISDEYHRLGIEKVEDEYYVRIEHDMTKQHYISFIAALGSDKIQMIKLYPEENAEARVKINGVRKLLFYCNRDGLFSVDVRKVFLLP